MISSLILLAFEHRLLGTFTFASLLQLCQARYDMGKVTKRNGERKVDSRQDETCKEIPSENTGREQQSSSSL